MLPVRRVEGPYCSLHAKPSPSGPPTSLSLLYYSPTPSRASWPRTWDESHNAVKSRYQNIFPFSCALIRAPTATMVRLKHRYLLINILYPEPTAVTKTASDVPDVVQFHQPTSDKLTAALLARTIRDGVAELFGDYGSGMVAGSLVGMCFLLPTSCLSCCNCNSRVLQIVIGWNLVKYLSPATSTAIVRVSRAHYRLVWAALSYVTRLPRPLDTPCVIQVVRVSGTIRKSEEEAIRRAKASILRAHRAGRADDLLNNLLGGTVEGAAGEGAQRGIEDQDIDYDEDDDE